MAFLADRILDNGLAALMAEADWLDICSAEPTTYAEALALSLGSKAAPTVGAPAPRSPSGRKVTVGAIADGTVSVSGTATHWALRDTVNERLLAAGALLTGGAVTAGSGFTLDAFEIAMPGVA